MEDQEFAEYVEFHAQNAFRAPKRYLRDLHNPLEMSDDQFKRRFRFRKDVVQNILVPFLEDQVASNRGLPISPILKILIALRYYATSSFQLVCADLYGVSQPSVCHIIREVSEALTAQIGRYIRFPENLNEIKLEFFNKAGFPGVIGTVDGTHIPIKSPGGANAEVFRNRKSFFSINVQLIIGPKEEIYDVVVRWPGSAHDSRIFDSSAVRVRLSEGQLRGLLLGDSGYPQREYLYTPVAAPNNDAEERYNRAHKVTRSIVERAIGRWKRRFPCLYFELQNNLRNTTRIITACAVLYNIGISVEDNWDREEADGGRDIIEVPVAPAAENLRGHAIRQNFILQHFQ